ncbi:MAG: hypothetical protein ABIQ39_05540 [Ilumatobacteraceae bacterium]
MTNPNSAPDRSDRRGPKRDTIVTPTKLSEVPQGSTFYWSDERQVSACANQTVTLDSEGQAWVYCPRHGTTVASSGDVVVNVVTHNPDSPHPAPTVAPVVDPVPNPMVASTPVDMTDPTVPAPNYSAPPS